MNTNKKLSAFEQASMDRMQRQTQRSVSGLDRKRGETVTQRDTRQAREQTYGRKTIK
tara:strand:+ start:203 stop:373 length:171 start_codon:yes stop_codon:yes gene_type:complete